MQDKIRKYTQRKVRVRANMFGTSDKPRLSVFRSNKYVYAQMIDDSQGKTLVSAKGGKATEVGESLAKKAVAKKIKKVVFDRGGFKYHGKVKELAEAARKGGLDF